MKSDGSWISIFRDSDWETKFIWRDISKPVRTREENIITAAIETIAAASGFKLNLDLAHELFDKGELKEPHFTSNADRKE